MQITLLTYAWVIATTCHTEPESFAYLLTHGNVTRASFSSVGTIPPNAPPLRSLKQLSLTNFTPGDIEVLENKDVPVKETVEVLYLGLGYAHRDSAPSVIDLGSISKLKSLSIDGHNMEIALSIPTSCISLSLRACELDGGLRNILINAQLQDFQYSSSVNSSSGMASGTIDLDDIRAVQSHKTLRSLRLEGNLSPDFRFKLTELSRLNRLELVRCNASIGSLPHSLEHVALEFTALSHSTLAAIVSLPHLKSLTLNNCKLSLNARDLASVHFPDSLRELLVISRTGAEIALATSAPSECRVAAQILKPAVPLAVFAKTVDVLRTHVSPENENEVTSLVDARVSDLTLFGEVSESKYVSMLLKSRTLRYLNLLDFTCAQPVENIDNPSQSFVQFGTRLYEGDVSSLLRAVSKMKNLDALSIEYCDLPGTWKELIESQKNLKSLSLRGSRSFQHRFGPMDFRGLNNLTRLDLSFTNPEYTDVFRIRLPPMLTELVFEGNAALIDGKIRHDGERLSELRLIGSCVDIQNLVGPAVRSCVVGNLSLIHI